MLLTMLALVACVEPFEYGRHDLVDLRIVGMAYKEGTARAFVWEGTQAWSAQAPAQVWSGDTTLTECPETADCAPAAGPLAATVVVASGTGTETGTLTLESKATTPVLGDVLVVWDGDVATLTLDAPETHTTRWMAPAGDLVEVEVHAAKFNPDGDGLVPVVALTTDGLGGNAWTIVDVATGEVGPSLQVGLRTLPLTQAPVESAADWLATIVEADNLYGFALDGLRPDDGSADASGCGIEAGYWNPNSIVERSCGLDSVLGLTVLVSGTVSP